MVEQLSLTLTSERGPLFALSYGRLRNGKHKHYTHSFIRKFSGRPVLLTVSWLRSAYAEAAFRYHRRVLDENRG